MTTVKKQLLITESISFGWDAFKKNYKFALSTLGIMIAIHIVSSIFEKILDKGFLSALVTVAFAIVTIYISYGFLKATLQIADMKKPELSILKETSLLEFGYFFLLQIVQGLIVFIAYLFLIIPGIYLSLRFSMAKLSYADKQLPVFENLSESGRLTKGHKFKIFLLFLVLFLLNILGALVLLVGLLVTIPVSAFTTAHFFRKLQSLNK
jgi:uncharacterized membrane protein